MENIPDSQCSRMLPVSSPATQEKTFGSYSNRFAKDKTYLFLCLRKNGLAQGRSWETISPWRGECLMRNISELPRDVKESTLSQILMERVPEKYYLSPKACQGVLKRAASRGKELPPLLKGALERQASVQNPPQRLGV